MFNQIFDYTPAQVGLGDLSEAEQEVRDCRAILADCFSKLNLLEALEYDGIGPCLSRLAAWEKVLMAAADFGSLTVADNVANVFYSAFGLEPPTI